MTSIKIYKNQGNILGFTVSGHSGYASEGSDIICSAISAISQMVCVGLENVLNLKPQIKIDEESAFLSCFLKDDFEYKQAQTLFKSFEESAKLICEDKKIKKYINLEVKNEVY